MIAIVDYGLGNLGSIANMLKVIGEKSVITSSREVITSSDGIILPGVGAFDAGVRNLHETGLYDTIRQSAESGQPILGICLGMQLLGRKSEEGELEGLELIPFDCVRFKVNESRLKIPHMGWDMVNISQRTPLTKNLENNQRYYFVHSYHAICDDQKSVLMTCDYGYEFAAAVIKDNVMGVQFHPEKSHDFGMALLKNYVEFCRGEEICFTDQE